MTLSNLKEKLLRIHKSWTIWFNGICASLVVVLPGLQNSFPRLEDYLPHNVYQVSMGIIIVGNMILRFKTSQGLESK